MPRPRIHPDRPLTNAEKQARRYERQKAERAYIATLETTVLNTIGRPDKRKVYKVAPIRGGSDDPRETHFAVKGPRVNEFAVMDELAAKMQRALNSRGTVLSPAERDAVTSAIALVLAKEPPEDWSLDKFATLRHVMRKLSCQPSGNSPESI